MNRIVYILILIFSIPIHSQDLNTSISIVADRVVPFLFNSENNENLLLIRKQAGDKFLRFNAGIDYIENEKLNYSIGIGIDKKFISTVKWNYSYGIDLISRVNDRKKSSEKLKTYSIIPFLKIDYHLSKYFSLSIEPGIDFKFSNNNDYSSDFISNDYNQFDISLANLGQLIFSFNFNL